MCSDTDFLQHWFWWGCLLGNSANADDLSSRGSLEICQPVTSALYCFAFWELIWHVYYESEMLHTEPSEESGNSNQKPSFDLVWVFGYLSVETSVRMFEILESHCGFNGFELCLDVVVFQLSRAAVQEGLQENQMLQIQSVSLLLFSYFETFISGFQSVLRCESQVMNCGLSPLFLVGAAHRHTTPPLYCSSPN